MKYTGCIIEESLRDKSIVNEFEIIEEINDDGIMWIVETDESRLDDILPKLQSAMVEAPIWYCDLKCDDYHYIIYNDKIFKVKRYKFLIYFLIAHMMITLSNLFEKAYLNNLNR